MNRKVRGAAPTAQSLAAGWYARVRSGEMSPDEAARLEAWQAESPENRAAYEEVDEAWSRVTLARSAPEILAIRAQARRRSSPGWRAALPRAAAAVAAIAVVGAAGLWIGREAAVTESRSLRTEAYRTAVGERSTFTLRDGSVVTLNTNTVLRTEAANGRRLVFLDRGQAFFRVAKDSRRPFMVTAAGRTITALGTAFDVRVDGKLFEVTLVEGKVRVENPAPPGPQPAAARPAGDAPQTQATEMLPGSQLVAALDTQRWTVAPTDTSKETSWLTGWLNFDNEPLGEVAAEFNRYSPRKIVVADPALAATPVSGRFEADDVEAFTRALASYEIARVESASADIVRLAAP